MLNPLSIQSLQNSAGKSLPAAELVRTLPLNTPTQITIRQVSPDAVRPNQFTLQVQLGSQLYQLKSNQSLPPGSTASLTRTAAGQLLLSTVPLPAPLPPTAAGAQIQTLNLPATTQSQPIQQSAAAMLSGNHQTIAPDQPPIVQIKGRPQQSPQEQRSQQPPGTSSQQSAPPTPTATVPPGSLANLNRLLPMNRPVLATVSLAIRAATGDANYVANINGRSLPLALPQSLPFDGKVLLIRTTSDQVQIHSLTSPSQNQNINRSINDALRYVLPAQQPVANSLVKLQQLNSSIGGEKSPINSIISSLINLFGVKTGSAAEGQTGVQQNILNGGLFTERNLADPRSQISTGDMKHQLNQLLQQADKLPEQARQQLHELVKGLLNRVTGNQLESLQNTRVNSDGALERFFALDLPVKNGERLDNVELKISEHRRQQSEDEWQRLWRVRLHFDLQEQGTVDAELVLEQEHQVTAHFWCSNPATAEELNGKLPDFNRQLHLQGYSINSTHCSEGAAPKPVNQVEQLIDVIT
ncbi:flagellar hook-length control protein FliK [uncultured Amphritea sp.]|uniref:flagellar hook-length control protein FliK n=1 Tax=uncultured Amphritea sp. TaxID=981605 RepID=UPI00262CF560|nr:flagellar hook-length control protein FliK [uncultured Amphritea sp.]